MLGPSSFWWGPRTFLSVTKQPGRAKKECWFLLGRALLLLLPVFPSIFNPVRGTWYPVFERPCFIAQFRTSPPFFSQDTTHPNTRVMTCRWWIAWRFLTSDPSRKQLHTHPETVWTLGFVQEVCSRIHLCALWVRRWGLLCTLAKEAIESKSAFTPPHPSPDDSLHT